MVWWRTVVAQMSNEEVYYKPLNIPVSDTVKNIMKDLASRGKRALIVGGAVRDALLGIIPKDVDIEVYGVTYPELSEILSSYDGKVDFVGKAFGIIKFTDFEGNPYDFSLPRRESKKSGGKHTDFDIIPDSTMTPKDAASRRDFTMNALAFDPMTEEIHDYFGGIQDMEDKVLRHTSGAFSDDPLRVLRGMQFSSRLGFDIAPETAELAKQIANTFGESLSPDEKDDKTSWLAKERIAEEFMKLVTKGKRPSKMLKYLKDTGWMRFFPEIEALTKIPQEYKWHPEGWSFSVLPSDSFVASMTKSQPIKFLTRQLVDSALANSTGGKKRSITQ
jgi:tRNA nucleotidyltransferase (CCA-adding enzyme)